MSDVELQILIASLTGAALFFGGGWLLARRERAEPVRSDRSARELAKVTARQAEAVATAALLRRELEQERQRVAEAELASRSTREATARELTIARAERDGARREATTLRTERETLGRELGALRIELGHQAQELGVLRVERETFARELGALRVEHGHLDRELGTLRVVHGHLGEELGRRRRTRDLEHGFDRASVEPGRTGTDDRRSAARARRRMKKGPVARALSPDALRRAALTASGAC